jgi:hypothetical protein
VRTACSAVVPENVTDIDLLPGADGLELTALVRERYPLLPVAVLGSLRPHPIRESRGIVRDTTERSY